MGKDKKQVYENDHLLVMEEGTELTVVSKEHPDIEVTVSLTMKLGAFGLDITARPNLNWKPFGTNDSRGCNISR